MKRAFALLVAVLLTLGCSNSAFAANNDAVVVRAEDQRLALSMKSIVDTWESNRTISSIKHVNDFAGNSYTVVECSPTGYIIFNDEAALVLESAENSPSPYLGKTENLYYAGPTHYYYYDSTQNTYTHSVLETRLSEEEVISRTEVCQAAQIALIEDTDIALKNYIETGTQSRTATPLASSTYTYVGDNRDFFEEMDTQEEMSYWAIGNGACGYVASSIVLLYYHNFYNDDIIDTDTYPLDANGYYTGEDFTADLYQDIGVDTLGYGNSLNASKVATVMRTYLKNERDITVNTWYLNMPSKSDVVAQLKEDRPVVYVDRWNDPSSSGGTVDHDIVIYGYNSSNKLIAHFGWAGYTHVEASSNALALFISSACSITTY